MSNTTGFGNNHESELVVCPSPAKDLLNISVTNFNGIVATEIFDLTGHLIASSNKSRINIASFPRGVYLIKVAYGNVSNVVKVIKDWFSVLNYSYNVLFNYL